ncbi:MAG: flagellar biosynthetic protein FliR [Spirochaetota bacterium]
MNLDAMAENSQLFLLIFVRIFALIQISPLLSSGSVPQIVKTGLTLFTAVSIFPWVKNLGYPIPANGLLYAALLFGEIMVGIIIGFFLVVIYSAFLVAGQFFSLQMGFGASEVFDPLAQVEIPIMGQFLNIVAMFVFIGIDGFQRIFLVGVFKSFQTIRALDLLTQKQHLLNMFVRSLSGLFEQALVISFPVLGTLFLVSIAMGLLAKAAPQMNLLMLGFPISIGVAFIVLFVTIPFIMEAFGKIVDISFTELIKLFDLIAGGSS